MPFMAEGKLRLFDAVGMAIGGMVGGGIFAVLGQAVDLSGNAAFVGFGFAGVLALITGISYSRLTVQFDHSGSCFTFVEEVAGAGASGTMSWFLILGYVFTVGPLRLHLRRLRLEPVRARPRRPAATSAPPSSCCSRA